MATAPSTSPSPSSSRTSDARYDQLLSLSANLKEHLTSKAFSDITIACGDHMFDCHKVVLSSGCEFFRDLLLKRDLNLLDFSEVKANVIEEVLLFIYTGTCNITNDAIKDFLDIATKWKLSSLLRLCYKFIRENCTISHAGVFYSLLLQYQDQPTLEVVSYFIREHFTEMYSRRSFGIIPISAFCDLLAHDEINVKNEDEVFDSLVELVEDQPIGGDSKARYDVIRFQHISKDYLEGSVRSHPLMREIPQRDLIRDAIRYNYSKSNIIPRKKRYWKMQQPQDTNAESSKQINTTVSRHRKLHCINKQKNLCVFSENDNGWNVVLKVKAFIDDGTSIGMYKSGFVLAGACNSKFGMQVSYVDVSAHAQLRLPDLQESIHNPGVVGVGDDLYVIGGSLNDYMEDLDSVFKLSNGSKKWTYLPKLQTPMSCPQCVLLDEAIYVFHRDSYRYDAKMLRLKLNDKRWTLCKKIPESYENESGSFITYDDRLLIVKHDELLKFDPDRKKWTTESCEWPLVDEDIHTDLSSVTVLQYQGNLCAYAEDDGRVMSYDADNNIWLPSICYVPHLRRSLMLFVV